MTHHEILEHDEKMSSDVYGINCIIGINCKKNIIRTEVWWLCFSGKPIICRWTMVINNSLMMIPSCMGSFNIKRIAANKHQKILQCSIARIYRSAEQLVSIDTLEKSCTKFGGQSWPENIQDKSMQFLASKEFSSKYCGKQHEAFFLPSIVESIFLKLPIL